VSVWELRCGPLSTVLWCEIAVLREVGDEAVRRGAWVRFVCAGRSNRSVWRGEGPAVVCGRPRR